MANWLVRVIRKLLPDDDAIGPGYGPFRLPADHPFSKGTGLQVSVLHDAAFDDAEAGKNERTLDEEDWLLFYRWVLVVKAEQDPKRRCELAMDICRYWPLARRFGYYLWEGDEQG